MRPKQLKTLIRKYFPEARNISIHDEHNASWQVGGRTYDLSRTPPWYLSASEGNEDWGNPGESPEKALDVSDGWPDHGFMLTNN